MSEANAQLKERVRAFWQEHPCGTKFADASPGSRRFYELVEEHRYQKEWHIPAAADFSKAHGKKVLEIGCGLGTDGAQFALAGADYTGIDLTDAAVDLARRRFDLFNLPGAFRTADAENLDFPDESFDVVWAQESVAHPPHQGKQAFLREAYRVLRPGGRLMVEDAFRYRRPYPDEDEAFLHTFLSGWAIADIPTNEEFVTWTEEVGFHDLEQSDITANILPSMRYLYRMGLLLYPSEVPLRMLRIRSACQHANARSSLLQWRAYKKGLWYVQTLIARK